MRIQLLQQSSILDFALNYRLFQVFYRRVPGVKSHRQVFDLLLMIIDFRHFHGEGVLGDF